MVTIQLSVLLVILYFVPTFVAKCRRHNDGRAIFWLNILLGWTILGWIASLVWANTGNVEKSDHKVLPPA